MDEWGSLHMWVWRCVGGHSISGMIVNTVYLWAATDWSRRADIFSCFSPPNLKLHSPKMFLPNIYFPRHHLKYDSDECLKFYMLCKRLKVLYLIILEMYAAFPPFQVEHLWLDLLLVFYIPRTLCLQGWINFPIIKVIFH